MIYRFKIYGQRYAIDTKSMAFHELSEIQYDMLTYINLPPEDAFPSSLRYDLAKYESSKLKEAYFSFARLWEDGVLDSPSPVTVTDAEYPEIKAVKEFVFDTKRFVFANDVIRYADDHEGAFISAKEDESSPVKPTDYDIVALEYERIAKEIIKRREGRVPGAEFTFAPFILPFTVDENGYTHIADCSLRDVIENGNEAARKIIECAVSVYKK